MVKIRKIVRRRRGGKRMMRRRGKKTTVSSLLASSVRPNRLLVKLPYSDFYSKIFTSTGPQGQTQAWNLNSIFDPDRTGVGHQPLGYDQWATFYNRYRVFKVAYNISCTNLGADQSIYGGITATNGVFGNFTSMAPFEQPHTKKFHIGGRNGKDTITLKGVVNLPYITGRPLVSYKSDDTYQSVFGASPAEIMALNLMLLSTNPSAGGSVQVTCRLVYFVELYDPRPMPLSSTNPIGPNDPIPIGSGNDEQNE